VHDRRKQSSASTYHCGINFQYGCSVFHGICGRTEASDTSYVLEGGVAARVRDQASGRLAKTAFILIPHDFADESSSLMAKQSW
jgi:hypothetical protein